MSVSLRVGVLVSGEGTNLQALLDDVPARDIEIVGGRRRAGPSARGLERARGGRHRDRRVLARRRRRTGRSATTRSATGSRSAASSWWCSPASWSCSRAGFIRRFAGRIINVHPALLPAFPGLGAIEQALEHGVKVDRRDGPLRRRGRGQRADHPAGAFELPVPSRHRGDRGGDFTTIEHRLLPRAVRLIAAGRVRSTRTTPRLVIAMEARMATTEAATRWRSVAPGEVRVRRALLACRTSAGSSSSRAGWPSSGVEIVSTGGTARELARRGHRGRARWRSTPASRRSSTGA